MNVCMFLASTSACVHECEKLDEKLLADLKKNANPSIHDSKY